jgi:hypothetical protein
VLGDAIDEACTSTQAVAQASKEGSSKFERATELLESICAIMRQKLRLESWAEATLVIGAGSRMLTSDLC